MHTHIHIWLFETWPLSKQPPNLRLLKIILRHEPLREPKQRQQQSHYNLKHCSLSCHQPENISHRWRVHTLLSTLMCIWCFLTRLVHLAPWRIQTHCSWWEHQCSEEESVADVHQCVEPEVNETCHKPTTSLHVYSVDIVFLVPWFCLPVDTFPQFHSAVWQILHWSLNQSAERLNWTNNPENTHTHKHTCKSLVLSDPEGLWFFYNRVRVFNGLILTKQQPTRTRHG